MAFGLRHLKLPAGEIERWVAEASRILKLDELLKRKPRDLSGGQQQRVVIGRAIGRQPKVFLFDEPLSNLDASLRVKTRVEIARLHRELGSACMVRDARPGGGHDAGPQDRAAAARCSGESPESSLWLAISAPWRGGRSVI